MSKNKNRQTKASNVVDNILGVLIPEKSAIKAEKPVKTKTEPEPPQNWTENLDPQIRQRTEAEKSYIALTKKLDLTDEEIAVVREMSIDVRWLDIKISKILAANVGVYQKGTLNDLFAKEVAKRISIVTIYETDAMFIYYEPLEHWIGGADRLVKIILRRVFTDASSATIKEIVALIRLDTPIGVDYVDPKHLIPLNNGVYNIRTWKFEENRRDHFITRRIPVDYDKDAGRGEEIMKFINSLVDNKRMSMLAEYWAYCLYPDYPIAKAMLLIGNGSNGKTTFLNLLERFFGESNRSSLSLQQLESEFLINGLISKMVNIASDMGADEIRNTGIFKALTGEDSLVANIKYRTPITFRNRAKMIFGANEIPPVLNDKSKAFARRWQIVSFPFVFTDNPSAEHEKKGVDQTKLFNKLATPKEFSGWLNTLLILLEAVIKKNSFTFKTTEAEVLERFAPLPEASKNDLFDSIVHKEGSVLKKMDLYDLYVEEIGEDNALSYKMFNIHVKRRYPAIRSKKLKRGGSYQFYWLDIAVLDLEDV